MTQNPRAIKFTVQIRKGSLYLIKKWRMEVFCWTSCVPANVKKSSVIALQQGKQGGVIFDHLHLLRAHDCIINSDRKQLSRIVNSCTWLAAPTCHLSEIHDHPRCDISTKTTLIKDNLGILNPTYPHKLEGYCILTSLKAWTTTVQSQSIYPISSHRGTN